MRLKFDYSTYVDVNDTTRPLIAIPANSFVSYSVTIKANIEFNLTLFYFSENYRQIKEAPLGSGTEFLISSDDYGFAHFIIVMVDVAQTYTVYIQTETLYPV